MSTKHYLDKTKTESLKNNYFNKSQILRDFKAKFSHQDIFQNKNEIYFDDEFLNINPLKSHILYESGLFKIKAFFSSKNLNYFNLVQDINQYTDFKKNKPLFSEILKLIEVVDSKYQSEILFYIKELILNNVSNHDWETLIAILKKLNSIYNIFYGSNISSDKLIISCLSDISLPSSISQGYTNNCAITCVQTQLAIKNPIKYLEIIENLLKDNFYINNNQTINLNLDLKAKGRNFTSQIIQDSLKNFIFKNSEKRYLKKSKSSKGLYPEDILKVYIALFNDNYRIYNSADYNQNDLLKIIENINPSESNPIQISMTYETNNLAHNFHALNVIGIDKKYLDIKLINPWGREEIICLELFKNNINFIIAPSGYDKSIPRIPDSYFLEKADKFTEYIQKISLQYYSDDKLQNYLDCMTLEQKTALIVLLYKGKIKNKRKMLLLKILNSILHGSNNQNRIIIFNLSKNLENKSINFIDLITDLKNDDVLFETVINNISNSVIEWQDIISEIINKDYLTYEYL